MRTAHRVMIVLLLAACCPASAHNMAVGALETLDRDITVVGRDETAVAVPQPWKEDTIAIPDLDPTPLGAPLVPAILPPAGDWPQSRYIPTTLDPLDEKLS